MTDEKKDVVDFTEDQLSAVIGKAMTPITDSVKEISKRVEDLEARKERLVSEPEVDNATPTPKKKEFKPARKDPMGPPPEDEFSFVRFINAQRSGNWKGAQYEEYALAETAKKKSVGWASGSSGGYWVGEQFLPEQFIMNLRAKIILRNAGATVLPCTGAPVNIPAISAGATAYWVGQNANITASDSTPAQVQLTPKWCVGRSQISEFLLQTSQGAAETYLREDLASGIGLAADLQSIIGPGTSNKPTGIAKVSGVNTVAIGTNGGALTATHLHSMVYEVELDNVPEDGLIWIMHPRTWNSIRQLLINSEANHYLINPNPSVKEPRSILGYPVYRSSQLPINLTKGSGTALAYVILVNIREVLIGEWGDIEIKATDVGGNAWAQNAIEVKATYTFDVNLKHATSCCVLSDTTS